MFAMHAKAVAKMPTAAAPRARVFELRHQQPSQRQRGIVGSGIDFIKLYFGRKVFRQFLT
jgi:hypothetical protein